MTQSRRKVEKLLKGAERGSIAHLDKLEEGWPQKIEDSKRALTTLLRHFGEQMNTIPDLVHGRLCHHNVEHMFSSMQTCLSAMDGAFKFIDQADGDDRKAMLEILRGNVGGLLTWLETFAWYPSLAMPDAKEDFVTDNATLRVKKLLQLEFEGRCLLQDNPYLERVVDYALWIWMEGASPLHPVRATPENFRIIMGARLDLIAECTLGNFANDIILEKVNAMRQRDMHHLAIAFASHLLDWADFYRPIYQENPSKVDYTIAGHTVITAWMLSRWVRRFSRALRKVNFPKVIVKVAMDFPNLSAPGHSWGGGPVKSSFTPGLPSQVFVPSLRRAYDALRNVPDLLDTGLLDVLVGDLRTPPEGVQHYNWDEKSGGTPLQNLITLGHHPRIARVITNLRLPDDPIFLSEEASKQWAMFKGYIPTFRESLAEADSNDMLRCDSLEHHSSGDVRPIVRGKQCLQCHWMTYCSRECQRKDWKAIHRDECLTLRAHNNQLYTQGLSEMRETRRFGFALLKRYLLQALPTMGFSKPSLESGIEKPAKRLAYLIDFGRMPVFYYCLTADEVRAWTLPKSGGSVFGDDRSLALIRQYDEEGDRSIQLACSIARLSEFSLATIATYRVREPQSEQGGTGHYQVDFLNGYAQFLEKLKVKRPP